MASAITEMGIDFSFRMARIITFPLPYPGGGFSSVAKQVLERVIYLVMLKSRPSISHPM